ncbi:ABC transporter permease subunit [Ideonella sp. DXS29W]|uniref:ABC transporter permease subunit n=1 Tax=Ideonella lacteola TaxID=2984193 RepID=A0ABU9BKS5_9BURK
MTTTRDAAPRDPAAVGRWWMAISGLVLAWPVLVWCEFKPWTLFEPRSARATLRFAASFFPPRHDSEFLWTLVLETWRTVAMATAGITLALLIAVPLALLATSRLSVSAVSGAMGTWPAIVRQSLRALLVLLRSVPEVVWALLFVRVVGLGPTSGVLAIAIAYGGMLGKVYAEILESTDAGPTVALLRQGADRGAALALGTLPQCADELLSYTVYRWECAIRSSVVLGLVGAGGLGQLLDSAAKMFAGGEVASILMVFMGLVALSDRASVALRRRIA